jgi:Tannase and feruloyl esterase
MMRDLLKPVLVTAVIVLTTAWITGAGTLRPATAAARNKTAPRAAAAATVAPVVACGQLASDDFSNVPGAPTVVLSATQASGICQVAGYIAPQEQFLLTLPVSGYTGRYLQLGCGGLCGLDILGSAGPGGTASSTDSASQASATAAAPVSARAAAGGGMAMAFDNQGHIGGETDGVWAMDDPALRVSFGYASEHALAQAAKAILAAYYGKPPAFSYYEGGSDGGHEALVEAQRYPHDFNGILAGDPGNIEAQLLGVVPAWLVAVNTGPDGREVLTSEKLPALHAAVIKACGNARGLIEDPRSCDFNPATMRCPAGVDNSSCLTAAQVTVVREFYLGPNDGHGHYLYPGGEPYGSELAWAGVAVDHAADTTWPANTLAYQIGTTYLKYMAYWRNPPASFKLSDFHFTVAGYDKLLPLAGIYDATDPDLSAFQRAGGKLIIYQGWADQEISPFGTVDYYHAVVKHAGGFAASQDFSRLYMIPNQNHGLSNGSPQVNPMEATSMLLSSLQKWIEQGTAPGSFSFPLLHPTAQLHAISVQPLNPLSPPPGGPRGLDTRYHWIGQFRPGDEQWCSTQGMDLVCSHHQPPVSYTADTASKAGIAASSN